MTLLRKKAIGQTLDARVTKSMDIDAAAKGLARR